jgi:hypothetical protein
MPHVFHREPPGEWIATRLAAASALVSPRPFVLHEAGGACGAAWRLVRWGGRAEWAVLVPPGSRLLVNETPVTTGLRLLRHRDALRLAGEPPVLFFSTEEVPRVEPLEAVGDPLSCPRCRRPVDAGQAVVHCPACGLVHHQSPELPCWTYAATCAGCGQPTDLGAGLQWTPEDL